LTAGTEKYTTIITEMAMDLFTERNKSAGRHSNATKVEKTDLSIGASHLTPVERKKRRNLGSQITIATLTTRVKV
jgi:hypothetical protein